MSAPYAKVKTAVVGCGSISSIYIRNLKSLFSIIDLVALCNRTRSKAEEKAQQFGIAKVMTLEEIENDPEIELVVNLTPPGSHYEVTRRMLEAGKHVFTEKVMTTSLEEARMLVELAQSKGLYLGAAPDTVLGAGIQTARKVIDTGLIGSVTSGFVSITRNQNQMSEIFPFLRGEGGNLPYDVGVYYIGALIALLGPVQSICAFTAPGRLREKEFLFTENPIDTWTIPGSAQACASLRFASGAIVSVHMNGNTACDEQFRFEIYGTEGILKVGNPNEFDGKVSLLRPENPEMEFPFTHGYNGKNTLSEPMPFDQSGHRGVGAAEMAYAIRQGRPNRLSGAYGYHCLEVLKGIDEAAASGKAYEMHSSCEVRPLPSGHYSTVWESGRADAERSLIY